MWEVKHTTHLQWGYLVKFHRINSKRTSVHIFRTVKASGEILEHLTQFLKKWGRLLGIVPHKLKTQIIRTRYISDNQSIIKSTD